MAAAAPQQAGAGDGRGAMDVVVATAHLAVPWGPSEDPALDAKFKFDAAAEFGVHGWSRHHDGGLVCVNQEELNSQKGVLSDLLKGMASAIVQGKSVINVSLPVRLFEPRSVLERMTDCWCYAPLFLARASLAGSPVERLRWVMTFAVSGLHRACTNAKPFNPILGETFQGAFDDGTTVFMEQVSHHPPVSAFQIMGPPTAEGGGPLYHMHGAHEFTASFRPNGVVGQEIGSTHIDFPDGARATFHMPAVMLNGLAWGDRHFRWTGTVALKLVPRGALPRPNSGEHEPKAEEEPEGTLHAQLSFNPDDKNAFARLFSKPNSPIDTVRGEIWTERRGKRGDKQVLCTCEGTWLDGLWFDGKAYWEKRQLKPLCLRAERQERALPSDSRFREDLRFLAEGNQEEAQQWKAQLEELQRGDRRLRKKHEKIARSLARARTRAHGRSTSASFNSRGDSEEEA